jgi:outer membrane protein assembly factor BamB
MAEGFAGKRRAWRRGSAALLACVSLAILGPAACAKKDSGPPPRKTYALTVTRTEGIEGSPAAGTLQCDPGFVVNYDYHALDDYSNFAVKLDGAAIAAAGSLTMDADHTLAASCVKRVLWKFDTGSAIYYSCPAVDDDGTIYFGTGISSLLPGTLYALNSSGTIKWSYNSGSALFSPVIGSDGTVYVQDSRDVVYALSPAGALKWYYNDYQSFYFRDVGQRNPAIGADGTLYVASDGLYALDPATGRRIWHFSHPQYADRDCRASPAIGQDGTIYVVIGEDMLFAITPGGRMRWVFAFDNDWEMSFTSPAIDRNGVIYLATEGKPSSGDYSMVYAINPDGTQRWKYPVEGGRFVRASPAVATDGSIYIATKSSGTDWPAKLIDLSPSGQKLWDYTIERVHETPDDSYSTPSVGADGLLYFGAETGYLYALDPNGALSWKFKLRDGINWSSPAIASDGTLYIGALMGPNYGGRLYAVKTTSLGYASTPWPRFRHDRKNTGRYGS